SVLCGTSFLIYLLFFAKYSSVPGWVVGPRFLIPTLPFLIVAMAPAIQGLQQLAVLKRRPLVAVSALMVVLVGVGVLIQSIGTMFPAERYYYLSRFYEHKPAKPWWSGSIPLASIDFLLRMSATKGHWTRADDVVVYDRLTARHEKEHAFASADSAATEEEFFSLFPNPTNINSPNLMLLKVKLMGLPASVGIAYLVAAAGIGLAGAVGLRRFIVPPPSHS